MDIVKSFEVFLAEPLSVLKDRIVQIVGISTGTNMNPQVSADLLKQKTQITVVNSEKMYNLLKRVNSKPENLKKSSGLAKLFKKEQEAPQAIFGQLTLRL
ncbi:hypothetical protein IJ732_03215 [bacterium]|nr:hypothetical protein [bacterium]